MKKNVYNLLLVEDSLFDAKLLIKILKNIDDACFEVNHVLTIASAQNFLKKKKFDLIILDLMLPDSEGLKSLNKIKSCVPKTPIIILTGIDDKKYALKALSKGAQDYLIKGCVEKDLLLRSILYAIERNQLRLELENKLKEVNLLKTRMEYIIQSTPAVIYIKRVDKKHHFQFISENMKKIFGYDPEQFIQDPNLWEKKVHPEDLSKIKSQIASLSSKNHCFCEYRFMNKNEEWRWVQDVIRIAQNIQNNSLEIIGCITDITERKENEERIKYYAMYDQLTDLPNRRLFMDRMNQAIAQSKRDQKNFALLYIDLDKFKPINDAFGHAAGDKVLQEVASRLKVQVRSSDTIARIGGDEFAIILLNLKNIEYAGLVAQKLINCIINPISLDKISCCVGASIGISFYPQIATDVDALLQAADKAMYKAKIKGGNRFEYASPLNITKSCPQSNKPNNLN
jgi:diguanylate cyclase (GGDEF)-like protein/PAS domain S-box-containing protein